VSKLSDWVRAGYPATRPGCDWRDQDWRPVGCSLLSMMISSRGQHRSASVFNHQPFCHQPLFSVQNTPPSIPHRPSCVSSPSPSPWPPPSRRRLTPRVCRLARFVDVSSDHDARDPLLMPQSEQLRRSQPSGLRQPVQRHLHLLVLTVDQLPRLLRVAEVQRRGPKRSVPPSSWPLMRSLETTTRR
jgi:hypothetical protein